MNSRDSVSRKNLTQKSDEKSFLTNGALFDRWFVIPSFVSCRQRFLCSKLYGNSWSRLIVWFVHVVHIFSCSTVGILKLILFNFWNSHIVNMIDALNKNILNYMRSQTHDDEFNSNAGEWSNWKPDNMKSDIIKPNRLHFFALLSKIWFSKKK